MLKLDPPEVKSKETTMTTIINSAQPKAGEQSALWNGAGGRGWVEAQELLDQMLQPFEDVLVDALSAEAPGRVLDVGCGTGSTTLAFARQFGGCVGIDISEPMLALARARAERQRSAAAFVLADAQTHAFEPASFETIVSRFGVMFFTDPVQAFANIRRAAVPGGHLRFVAWRSAAENSFMTTAERVAAPLLPALPARRPDEPGQFAFGDPGRVRRILEDSGWSQIDVQPIDVPCTMPASELTHYVTRLGAVGRILTDAAPELRAELVERIRAAVEPYVNGAQIRFTGACWMVGARA
jgi:SAM-dependent methyltransferase